MPTRRVVMLATVVSVIAGAADGARARPVEPGGSVWSVQTCDGAKIDAGVARVAADPSAARASPADAGAAERVSTMWRRVRGVVDLLEVRDVREIGAMTLRKPVGMEPNEHATTLVEIGLFAAGVEARRVEVLMSPDGSVWSRGVAPRSGPGDGPATLEALDRERFLAKVEEERWGWYAGGFEPPRAGDEPGAGRNAATPAVVELAQPYVPGRYILDRETIERRLLGGRSGRAHRADRVLEIEKLYLRLPAGYDPRRPAGLVVWIDAGDEGRPPDCLNEALDAGNLIAAGFARCGNTRPVANRYQLALDAVMTASRRFHVDPRRVYAAGISGGGRVASIVTACFPDVFTGAVAMAGLSCPEAIPAGGGKSIPPAYAKPAGRLLERMRQRRIGAITGQKDFSQAEITAAAQVLRGAGVQAKVFSFPDLGHTLPSAAQFAEALAWVDDPYRTLRKDEIQAGERALKAAVGSAGPEAFRPRGDADRAALMKVTEIAPWTPAAWTAIELLERDGGE